MTSKLFHKLFAAILLVAVILSLTSCGHTRKEKISDKMYDLGVAAVEIADDYLSGKISIEDAVARLDRNNDDQYRHLKSEEDELGVTTLYDTPFRQDTSVWLITSNLLHAMQDKKSGTGIDASIKEKRNSLANSLWK